MGYQGRQDNDGLYYVLDDEHQRLICFDKDGSIRSTITNPSDEISSGLYIDNFAVAKEGIYLAVTEWNQMLLAREAILFYDHNGNYVSTLTNRDYSDFRTNKHRFQALESKDGEVRFIECMENELIAGDQTIHYPNAFNAVCDAVYDGDVLYVMDKIGKITAFSGNDKTVIYDKYKDEVELEPYRMCVDQEGTVFFTDIRNGTVRRVDPKEKKSSVVVDETASLTVQKGADGSFLLIEDGLLVKSEAGEKEYISLSKNNTQMARQIVCILIAILIALIGLLFLLRLIGFLIHRKYTTTMISSMMSILMVAIVSAMLCSMMMTSFRNSYSDKIREQIKSAAYMVANQINGQRVINMQAGSGFGGADYNNLVKIMERSFTNEIDFYKQAYCNIITMDEDTQTGYAVAFLDQSIGAYLHLGEEDTQMLAEVYENKGAVWTDSTTDVSGTYMSVKVPIFTADDHVAGAVEVGAETYVINDTLNAIVFKVFMSVLVILMMVWVISSEIMAFVSNHSFYQKELRDGNTKALPGHLIRMLVFLIFSAYNIATTFLPVYLLRRTDIFPKQWQELAGAVPITVNIFIIGLMSLLCANLVKRFGLKRIMAMATICSCVGNALMFVMPGYATIALGLVLDGIGVGLITNAIYIVITYIEDPISRTWGLTLYNGACLSGINFGMLAGSLLAVSIGQRFVFLVIALSWLSLLFLGRLVLSSLGSLLVKEPETMEETEAPSSYPLGRFITAKPVWSFIALIQNPYIVFGSFVFYFLPLYCDSHGYNETICSALIMLYSEVAVLAGPSLTKWLKKHIGSFSMYAAVMLNVIALGWFALQQGLFAIVITLIIMGFSAAFGKPVQQDYYLDLDESKQLGEDQAMGIYNFTENIGESLGPIIIGRLMFATPLLPVMTGFLGIITGTNVLHFLLNRRTLVKPIKKKE
jgi:predicted MFS family arabinose efflux permease